MKKLKDKKIELLKSEVVEDDFGCTSQQWIRITPTPIWAYFRQLSAKEYYAARAIQATEEVLFTINWRDDIDTTAVVKFIGKYYEITRIDVFEGNKTDLNIYCKSAPAGFKYPH